jgi:ankyrin repeat protein
MGKPGVVAIVLASLFAPTSSYPQTTNFIELVKIGPPRAVQAAIDNGVDLEARDESGNTPLLTAATLNLNPEVITMLLKAGADPKAQNSFGATALTLASGFNRNPEVVATLLRAASGGLDY